mmetsp:Transcript_1548/g.3987  ORF Transcript_1548/g.3987 Transcript_1548/m.3987 type:complete len:402 (-) Transcript_1548:40-1245(-)
MAKKSSEGDKVEEKKELVFKDLPDEARCKPEGAIVDARGRLENAAYKDLVPKFSKEPILLKKHPDPQRPGVNAAEEPGARMRWWSDPRGEGWIASSVRPPPGGKNCESKWFNRSAWGSWRLAFLLARLQRDFWAQQDGKAPDAPAKGERREPASSSSTATVVPSTKRKAEATEKSTSPAKEAKTQEGSPSKRGRGRPRKESVEESAVAPESRQAASETQPKVTSREETAAAKDRRYRLRLKTLFPSTQKKKEQAKSAAIDRALEEAVAERRTRFDAEKREREQQRQAHAAEARKTSFIRAESANTHGGASASSAAPPPLPKASQKEELPQSRSTTAKSASLRGSSFAPATNKKAVEPDHEECNLTKEDMDELERELLAIGKVIETEDMKMSEMTEDDATAE